MKKYVPRYQWLYIGHSINGTSFVIDGIDVWKYPWMATAEQKTKVKDPQYNQDYSFPVYKIEAQGKTIKFATGEFSNGVWGFYVLKDLFIADKV